ncbi:MAG: hypothetical protein GQ527_09205, partial [Bacteroidales bacterium]|nr:hypothetical protein [Bacteroidales bacterium]
MKKNIFLFWALILFAITSCNKDKPPVGLYEASFFGTYQDSTATISKIRGEYMWIINSYTETLDVARCSGCSTFSLAKGPDKSISGLIEMSQVAGWEPAFLMGPITVDGKWSKEDDEYIITGDFSYIYTYIDEPNDIFDE